MTLIIAWMLIAGFNFHWILYPIVTVAWGVRTFIVHG